MRDHVPAGSGIRTRAFSVRTDGLHRSSTPHCPRPDPHTQSNRRSHPRTRPARHPHRHQRVLRDRHGRAGTAHHPAAAATFSDTEPVHCDLTATPSDSATGDAPPSDSSVPRPLHSYHFSVDLTERSPECMRGPRAGPTRYREQANDRSRLVSEKPLSRVERRALGKAIRAKVPLDAHTVFEPGAGPGSGGPTACPSRHQGPRAGADPARADAGLAVHVLPWGGAADGGRPGRDAHVRPSGPAVRGCSPGELRRIRLTRAATGVRRQRLRRDASRPLRMGRQASGREPGRGRTRQRLHRPGVPHGRPRRRPELPHRDAGVRPNAAARRLVRPPRGRGGRRQTPVPARQARPEADREGGGEGPHPRQPAGAGQAHHRRGRTTPDRQRPTPDRAGRRAVHRHRQPKRCMPSSTTSWTRTRTPSNRTAAT